MTRGHGRVEVFEFVERGKERGREGGRERERERQRARERVYGIFGTWCESVLCNSVLFTIGIRERERESCVPLVSQPAGSVHVGLACESMCVCMCASVRVCVCACVRLSACLHVWLCFCVCLSVCVCVCVDRWEARTRQAGLTLASFTTARSVDGGQVCRERESARARARGREERR
jgi:hypothetical protein